MRQPVALLITALLLGACSVGFSSGGSSGDDGDDSRPPSFFETAEYNASYGLAAINASSAYATGVNGRGVTVGVIDTGIDRNHPEFAGAIASASIDIVSGSPDNLDDQDGHGTAVAGILAARRNGELSHGVAYNAQILAVRADTDGSCASGCTFDQADIAAGTDYAVANGARVINYSLGGASALGPVLGAALRRATDAGAVLVLAAGNDGAEDPTFPAQFASTAEAGGTSSDLKADPPSPARAGYPAKR
jgi:subtilisin family serine protease